MKFDVDLRQNHTIMSVERLGKQIRERRKVLRVTQPHLAELAGVSVNTLYKLERGKANPTLEVLLKITDILGLEVKLEIRKL